MQRETLGSRHPSTLFSIGLLSLLLVAKGKYEEAESLCREVLEAWRETLGNRHPNTLIAISNLGSLLATKGKYEEAESLCSEVLELKRETIGSQHPSTLIAISDLDRLLLAKGVLRLAILAEKLYGAPRRWMCGARRLAVGTRARLGPRSASVTLSVGRS